MEPHHARRRRRRRRGARRRSYDRRLRVACARKMGPFDNSAARGIEGGTHPRPVYPRRARETEAPLGVAEKGGSVFASTCISLFLSLSRSLSLSASGLRMRLHEHPAFTSSSDHATQHLVGFLWLRGPARERNSTP